MVADARCLQLTSTVTDSDRCVLCINFDVLLCEVQIILKQKTKHIISVKHDGNTMSQLEVQ